MRQSQDASVLQCGSMILTSSSDSSYRVTLFFGPEPVEGHPEEVACVFNVKKRSWKAGIQVSVHINTNQLSLIRQAIRLNDRLSPAFETLVPADQKNCEDRSSDLFAQAICWCKLDLRLQSGLTQHNQHITADELLAELDRDAVARQEYVLSYILTELDLSPDNPSPSSYSPL